MPERAGAGEKGGGMSSERDVVSAGPVGRDRGWRRALLVAAALVVVLVGAGALAVAGGGEGVGGDDAEGLRIVLQPVWALAEGEVDVAAEVVARRTEALGLGGAEVRTEGERVIVIVPRAARIGDPAALGEVLGRRGELRFRPVLQEQAVPRPGAGAPPGPRPGAPVGEVTPPEADRPGDVVTLEDADGQIVYLLGPSVVGGDVVESARPEQDPAGGWAVSLTLRPGAAGIDQFNLAAAACSPPSAPCPTGKLAIVLDSVVHSAPTVQQPTFERDAIRVSGGFSPAEADAVALVLSSGTLPAAFTAEVVDPAGR
jgi:preprotein translocase subunit SecD